jgi:putative hydroxymethylpyrimidine transport system substrate-binding protein
VNPTPRRTAAVLSALLAALVLAACGERTEPTASAGGSTRVNVMLDYLPNVDHAGLYAAQGEGLFTKAKLDVRLQTPSDPSAPLKLLAAGKADIAISYEPDLLLARRQGLKVMAVAALAHEPLTSLMSVGKRPITDPKQLRGKKVGTAGIPYQDAYLKTILAAAGVPATTVSTVDVGFNLVPTMLSKKVDATLGAFWNIEGVQLQRQDRKPEILRLDALGVPTYDELVLVATEDTVRNRGEMLRRFLQQLARGTESLQTDPQAGIGPLVEANADLSRPLQEAQLAATLPVLEAQKGRAYGWMDPGEWDAFGQWMQRQKLLPDGRIAARSYTNEFLPGEGI